MYTHNKFAENPVSPAFALLQAMPCAGVFAALPLRFENSDGSPVRAIIIEA